MRTSIPAVAALAALASASTTSIDIDAISVAVPTSVFVLPVVYVTEEGAPTITATTLASTATAKSDPSATNVFDSAADVTAAISSASELAAATATPLSKRDASCLQQPLGISYNSVPDTAAAFAADGYYGAKAVAAGTPSGYVQTFSNLTASNSADQYMGFTLLSSYDVATCVNKCSAISNCMSVNIYFERDPTVNPDNSACSNPSSTVNIKCVFWGGAVTAANANNFGQWRDDFQVLIAGSNGYMNSSYAAALANKATATSSSSSAAASATDVAGNVYSIYFNSDSTTGAYSNAQAASSYTDCMTACDADFQCNAFTYVGGANGVGSGTCWLKTGLGSASPAGNNVVSGSRSGKASSSSSSKAVSTTSSSSSSSSVVSTSSSSSSSVVSTSSSSIVASTSSVSKTSSSSTSVAPSTTSSSTSVAPTTMSTVTKSASTTSASTSTSQTSSSTTTSSTPLSTPFYIVPQQGYYAKVAAGSSASVGYSTSQNSATKFQIDNKTGYLVEATGNVGYAASMPQGVNTNQKLLFNPTGTASNNYVKCSINESQGWLECSANGVGQLAYACSTDNYSQMYFGPSIPSQCSWIGLYRVAA